MSSDNYLWLAGAAVVIVKIVDFIHDGSGCAQHRELNRKLASQEARKNSDDSEEQDNVNVAAQSVGSRKGDTPEGKEEGSDGQEHGGMMSTVSGWPDTTSLLSWLIVH